jgi:hypothetical protein
MAAKHATEVYDYGEAVRLLERAIKVQEVFTPDDKTRQCDLLLSLCEALYSVPDFERLKKEAESAFLLAQNLGEKSHASQICTWVLFCILSEQLIFATPESDKWIERVDRYAGPGTIERIYADFSLGIRTINKGDRKAGLSFLERAVDMARSNGDQRAWWVTASFFVVYSLDIPERIKKSIQLTEELWAGPHDGLTTDTIPLLAGLSNVFMMTGNRQAGIEVRDELKASAERTGNIKPLVYSTVIDSRELFIDGHLEAVLDLEEIVTSHKEKAGLYAFGFGHWAKLYIGESFDYKSLDFSPSGQQISIPCLLQAHLGNEKEVSEILDKYVVKRPGIGTPEDETSVWVDIPLLEAAVLVRHQKAAELILHRLDTLDLSDVLFISPICVPRVLGGASGTGTHATPAC